MKDEKKYEFEWLNGIIKLTRKQFIERYRQGTTHRIFAADIEALLMRREVEAKLNAHS